MTTAQGEDQMSLLGGGPPTVRVRAAERNALARVVVKNDVDEGDRVLLQALLLRMDRARRSTR